MTTEMLSKNVIDQINKGLASDNFSLTEMVAVNQIKNDRLKELFAHLFKEIEGRGHCVYRIAISPQVMQLIRQTDYKNFQFNESTRKEFLTVGMVGYLWTADVYMDKDCVGIVLYSIEDADKITNDHPSLKAKWNVIYKGVI